MFYQIEIIVSGGPIGYRYSDIYKTEISLVITDVKIQYEKLSEKIKKEKYERKREAYLITYDGINVTRAKI